MEAVYQRITGFIHQAHQEHSGKNILVVTHNGVMKSLFMADAAFRGADIEYRSFDLGNCAVVVLEVDAQGKM